MITFPGNTDSFYDRYICFLGVNDEEPNYELPKDISANYYLEKAVRVKTLQATLKISLSGALGLVGVTPEEWENMRNYFFEYN
jgi:hypothetical protein